MNRLRAFRDIEGINQGDLADILGVSVPMISAIESGRRSFKGDLEILGYGNNRLSMPDMSEPIHRARASTTVSAKKRAKELLRLAGEVFGELLNVTAKAPSLLLQRQPPAIGSDEIEELALELRGVLGQEDSGPIRNLTALVERAGVCLVPIVNLPGLDGISAWVNDVPVIGLDPSVSGDRFRFSLAHECAHLIFHDRRHDSVESEANQFAGALLFPRDDFDAAMIDKPKLTDFVHLKGAWGMSAAAIIYRAHELDYIDDARYRALQIQMSRWRKNEPGEFQPVVGSLFPRLVEVNGGPTVVAKSLGVNGKHLRELLNWNRLRLA
ncbi:XRE family transcriptional regulator [Mycolicibacter senuensis]|uniref:XRE family transcriptional regulator n=1 Tax=Mycolicibacter senuensis TaxID=386913 RepID=A0A7I9XNB5_9MYCO|nr:XRE family transcriptional regulator [Mycolicibacter senuensis]ORW69954.1 DNA-binding protein [Mycolicibacter senuensis]GFG71472.1 XRE family transcriptional regulator [Mycolicibacter senuensis]